MAGAGDGESKLGIVLVNAGRLDFDQKLDLSLWDELGTVSRFESDASPEEIVQRAEGQTVLVTKEIPVPREAIANLPDSVQLICEAGTGFNNVDLDAAREKGITVCNIPAYSTNAVAQLVITFLLNFSCSLVQQQRMLMGGDINAFSRPLQYPHFELEGKTLGLVGGSGAIGLKVADLALAMGMQVLVFSRSKVERAGIEWVPALEDLLCRSDFVSIHCPLNPSTKHLIDKDALSKMKPSAYIINTARGAVIKEEDLIEALQAGAIAGAGLDVQDPEPPSPDSPLYTLENVILTPHIGWKRLETRQRLMDLTAGNISAFLEGSATNVVS